MMTFTSNKIISSYFPKEEKMNDKPAKHGLRSMTVVIILVIVSLSCLCLPANLFPTSPSPTPSVPSGTTVAPVMPPTDTITAEVTQPGVETPVSSPANLNETGPWLLVETNRGLWASNADGSGMGQLTDADYWNRNLNAAVQPGGNKVVFLSPAAYDFNHMTLNLLNLPEGTVTKITDLTSPATEAYTDASPGDFGNSALQAVRDEHNYAWSPDGTRLAFVGLMDGPSAEIYLYETETEQVKRVSTDDAQNYWPSWSPDGNTLLYLGTDFFGVGAGFDTTGVWLANGDGTGARLLFEPESGSTEIAGWMDATTVVLDTWTPTNANEKLRLFDIVTIETSMLSEDLICPSAADSWLGAAIFANNSGLYLLTSENRTPVRISQEKVAWIDPMEPGEYFFTVHFVNGSLATYGTSEMDYQVSPIREDHGRLDVAMYGWIWGWTSEDNSEAGAWIAGPGIEIGKIFDYNARLPTWDQDNNLLFFAPYADTYGYNLYRTTFDAYYRDLEMVGFIDAKVFEVAWLGGQ
jgi:hypothetical protein